MIISFIAILLKFIRFSADQSITKYCFHVTHAISDKVVVHVVNKLAHATTRRQISHQHNGGIVIQGIII